MAILYGTTSEGESLPVEVNEFGQLVAEGLPGEPGPPGPPGLPKLPPDPFEGALLGWKDNTLAWLGEPVPLPENTYGPIINYANGILTLENEVSLPYLTAIFLSDAAGNRWFYTPISSAITNVSGNVLTLTDDTNLANFRVGDAVQAQTTGNLPWNETQFWSDFVSPSGGFGGQVPANAFNGSTGGAGWGTNTNVTATLTIPDGIPCSSLRLYSNNDAGDRGPFIINDTQNLSSDIGTTPAWGASLSVTGGRLNTIQFPVRTGVAEGWALWAVEVDGKLLVDPVLFKIAAIDEAAPSITTDGGTGKVGQVVVGPLKSGEGTVQSTTSDAIILRENNDEWCVGKYVTAPEQNLAARYVYEEELKKKLL